MTPLFPAKITPFFLLGTFSLSFLHLTMTDHHHHDHSNCNHDHDNTKKVTDAVNDELALRQKTAEKLTKVIIIKRVQC